MKKALKAAAAILIMLALVRVIAAGLYTGHSRKIGTFSVKDYAAVIDRFPSGKVLGSVDSAHDAKIMAESVWKEVYGKSVTSNRPYLVSYDPENAVWLVKGSLHPFASGGVPYILIREQDGKVLAVWHDK